jgi:hypothetical protein
MVVFENQRRLRTGTETAVVGRSDVKQATGAIEDIERVRRQADFRSFRQSDRTSAQQRPALAAEDSEHRKDGWRVR